MPDSKSGVLTNYTTEHLVGYGGVEPPPAGPKPAVLPLYQYPVKDGGSGGTRTLNILLAGQALYQLSYTPTGMTSRSLSKGWQLRYDSNVRSTC